MACRHDYHVTDHRILRVARGNGVALPKFEVYEQGVCRTCKVEGYRLLTTLRAHDAREAGVIARIPEADLPPPEASSKSPAVQVSLTSWPFPVSTHFPKEPA